MASFMISRQSARAAGQTLFYVQAVDQAKSAHSRNERIMILQGVVADTQHPEDEAAAAGSAFPLGHES